VLFTCSRPSCYNIFMKRFLKPIYALLIILILAVISLHSSSGVIYIFDLKKEIGMLRAENEKLKVSNEDLRNNIKELETNNKLIESMARSKLGLVSPDEIVYEFKD
jgi:cell division protein FtsB